MSQPLRVLLVEDTCDDATFVLRELKRAGYDVTCQRVETSDAFLSALDDQEWDLVLSDYSLPGFSGPKALSLLHEKGLDLPFIIVSRTIGEDSAVAAMKAGAHDYIMKENLARLVPAVERELREARDRSQRRKAEQALRENERRFRSLIENATDLITVLDVDGIIRYESPSAERVLGYPPREMVGQKALDYVHPGDVATVSAALQDLIHRPGGGKEALQFRIRHRDGSWRFLEAVSNNSLEDPDLGGIIVNSRDITQRKRDEETIRHLAYYDALTGLPNRTLFYDRLTQALAYAHRSGQRAVVMFLDLDRFKNINDTLGHAIGDSLLREVARRLGECVREGDTVSRLGGDEFTLLMPGLHSVQDTSLVAQKILDAFKVSFQCDGHELNVTASAGLSLYPTDGIDAETLLRNADTALYRAKEQGRDNYQLYTPAMNAKAFERLVVENNLRRGLEREEFVLHYQPQVDLCTGLVVGVEALVRWQHPDLGLVLPVRFIPVAEETGLIVPLGEWVLRKACEQSQLWRKLGFGPRRVAVNLSMRHLKDPSLTQAVKSVLHDTGIDPAEVELELTESMAMEDAESTIEALQALKRLGVNLAIDDFGTGYASLNYLKRLPIDTLKIDRSFVRDVTTDSNDAAIVKLVIAIAHSLKLKVVAEGVETEGQAAFLREHLCDEMQGYLLSKAVPASVLTTFFASGRPLSLSEDLGVLLEPEPGTPFRADV